MNSSTIQSSPTNLSQQTVDNSRYLQELMQELQMMTNIYENNNSAKFKNAHNLLIREIQRVWAIELSPDSASSPTTSLLSPLSRIGSPIGSKSGDYRIFSSTNTSFQNFKTPDQSRNKTKLCGDSSSPPQKFEKRDKIYFPEEDETNSNLVGRIIGPRGMTIRQLEKDFDCNIYIRGTGCMRDEEKEEKLRGKSGWEHLKEKLHVLLMTKGETEEQCDAKLAAARERIKELMTNPDDVLKKRQLIQLAVIEGTLRE